MKKQLVALPLAALALTGTNSMAADKPNVVIILADDLGWGDVGYHGAGNIETPNIDRIAREGIELDRYYVAPISSPTRAGLMTGRYPSRVGFREAVIPPWRPIGLPEEERTIADVLGENGYDNRAVIGKWHLGHSRKVYYPLNRGFTHFYGHLNGAIEYFTHYRDGELDWHDDWESCYDKGYSTDLITDEAVKCIKEYSKKDSPYFLYVAYNAPHSPFEAPEDEIAEHIPLKEFKAIENNKERNKWIYKAMVTRMDKGIGRIWKALEKSGQLDNTIVLFSSDNGGDLNASCNTPLRGSKFTEWDGGVRVPAAIYWKNGFENGRKLERQVVGFVDILPTIADIIGVKGEPARPYDGISVYPVLKGETEHIDRDLYLGLGSVVNSDYKLILTGFNGQMPKRDFIVEYANDPYENSNRIEGNAEEYARLKSIAVKYDTITPAFPEVPYGHGSKGFKSPKEWQVTEP